MSPSKHFSINSHILPSTQAHHDMSSAKDTKPTDETHDTTVEATDSTSATEAKKGSPQASPFDDEDHDDLEVHPAVSAVPPPTETTTATGNTTPPTTNTAEPTEREAKLAILTEAFPTVEKEVCEFVLESHRGNVEASINALLEISDPEFQPEPAPPAPAPVPIASHIPNHLAPPLPQRQPDALAEGVANLNLSQQPREIDVSGKEGRPASDFFIFPPPLNPRT